MRLSSGLSAALMRAAIGKETMERDPIATARNIVREAAPRPQDQAVKDKSRQVKGLAGQVGLRKHGPR